MSPSELRRKLLYCGHSDVMDYLTNSPLHQYIYKQLLEQRYQHHIDTPVLTILNEVYFQCVNVQCDRNPGLDVRHRYLIEEANYLGAYDDAQLVFCVVWAFMKSKGNLSFSEECFMSGICQYIVGGRFDNFTDSLIHFIQDEDIILPNQFDPMPCPTLDLSKCKFECVVDPKVSSWGVLASLFDDGKIRKVSPWKVVTEDYNHNVIEWLVMLYSSRDDKINLLRMIEESFHSTDKDAHGRSIEELRERVNMGVFMEEAASGKEVQYKQEEVEYKQERDTLKHMTINKIVINTAHQVNINPQKVENHCQKD